MPPPKAAVTAAEEISIPVVFRFSCSVCPVVAGGRLSCACGSSVVFSSGLSVGGSGSFVVFSVGSTKRVSVGAAVSAAVTVVFYVGAAVGESSGVFVGTDVAMIVCVIVGTSVGRVVGEGVGVTGSVDAVKTLLPIFSWSPPVCRFTYCTMLSKTSQWQI